MTWLPIESAPRDKTCVLVTDGASFYVAWYEYDGWSIAWHDYDGPMQLRDGSVTHWIPLPPPPEGGQE